MAESDRRPVRPEYLRQCAGTSRGIALVLVLWVLTLLTVMAVGMTAAQRTETALTENLIADARFRALADAAITYTVYNYIAPPAGEGLATGGKLDQANADLPPPWLPNGAPRPWGFDGKRLTIAVSNEQSRINLNQAPAEVLAALLKALGVEEEPAMAIADAISDFRDGDDLKLMHGAEDADYQEAGRALGAKDAPFVAVEELQQVLGGEPRALPPAGTGGDGRYRESSGGSDLCVGGGACRPARYPLGSGRHSATTARRASACRRPGNGRGQSGRAPLSHPGEGAGWGGDRQGHGGAGRDQPRQEPALQGALAALWTDRTAPRGAKG